MRVSTPLFPVDGTFPILLSSYTAVCRELANQKSEKRNCAWAVLEISKEKLERIAFRFFWKLQELCKPLYLLSQYL